MEWPGLTSNVYRGQEVVKMHQHGPRQEYFDNLFHQRSAKPSFRALKIPPILRGWTGNTMAGRSTDPPDPVGDCKMFFKTESNNLRGIRMVVMWIK